MRWPPYCFAGMMLLGCDQPARKSLTSKGTAVPPDLFESEFPSSPSEPSADNDTSQNTGASVSGDGGSSVRSDGPASTAAASGGSAAVASEAAASSASDATSAQIGSALLFQVLNVDLSCGAKPAGGPNYLCVNTECADGLSISQPWALPDGPTVIYDVEVALTGNVETFPNVSGAVVATNDNLSVISAAEPTLGEPNLYQLQVGDANYVLNAGDEAGFMYPLESLTFTLKGIPGGTSVVLKVLSSDCNQVSICELQGDCTDVAVTNDGQHLEVRLTAMSS